MHSAVCSVLSRRTTFVANSDCPSLHRRQEQSKTDVAVCWKSPSIMWFSRWSDAIDLFSPWLLVVSAYSAVAPQRQTPPDNIFVIIHH